MRTGLQACRPYILGWRLCDDVSGYVCVVCVMLFFKVPVLCSSIRLAFIHILIHMRHVDSRGLGDLSMPFGLP